MPQVKIEYSKELEIAEGKIGDLFNYINKVIIDILGVSEDATKYRAFQLDQSRVGNGNNYRGFMHIIISVLKKSERTQDMFDDLCKSVLEYSAEELKINKNTISVELREMDGSKYYNFKE